MTVLVCLLLDSRAPNVTAAPRIFPVRSFCLWWVHGWTHSVVDKDDDLDMVPVESDRSNRNCSAPTSDEQPPRTAGPPFLLHATALMAPLLGVDDEGDISMNPEGAGNGSGDQIHGNYALDFAADSGFSHRLQAGDVQSAAAAQGLLCVRLCVLLLLKTVHCVYVAFGCRLGPFATCLPFERRKRSSIFPRGNVQRLRGGYESDQLESRLDCCLVLWDLRVSSSGLSLITLSLGSCPLPM